MSRGPATFKKRDAVTAIKAALSAGLAVERVEVGKDGKIVIVTARPNEAVGGTIDEVDRRITRHLESERTK